MAGPLIEKLVEPARRHQLARCCPDDPGRACLRSRSGGHQLDLEPVFVLQAGPSRCSRSATGPMPPTGRPVRERRRHANRVGLRAPDGGSTAHSEPHDRNGNPAAGRLAPRRRWVRRRYRGVIARHAQDTPAPQPTTQAAAAAATADRIQPAPGPCTSRGAGWAMSCAGGSSTGRSMSCAAGSSTGVRGAGRAMSCAARSRTGCGTARALSCAMTDHPLQGRSSQYRSHPRVQTEAEVPDGAGPPAGDGRRGPSSRRPGTVARRPAPGAGSSALVGHHVDR
jgi:hypothetical protein